jgi:hypothetical protein
VNEFIPTISIFLDLFHEIWYKISTLKDVQQFFFHENQCSERHSLNKGISIILTILSMFSPSLDKIWWRELSYNAVEHM